MRGADVLVENYRAGVMDKLGLGYESLREINPKLVYAAIRGFGDPRTGESPYVDWPAYDVIAQAMGGMMGITGPKGSPTKIGPGVGDTLPAALTAFGLMAAVYRANKTGEGQFVDVAMYDAVLAFCERIVYQYSYTNQIPGPEGNGHPLLCPFGLVPGARRTRRDRLPDGPVLGAARARDGTRRSGRSSGSIGPTKRGLRTTPRWSR